ncbi:integrin alpha-L [Pelodytes ibericus]
MASLLLAEHNEKCGCNGTLGFGFTSGYNLAVSAERSFTSGGLFGYRVRQFNSTSGERIIVGNPESGDLHIYSVSGESYTVTSPPRHSRHFGLTLEVDQVAGEVLVCGLGTPRDCDRVLYMNGACYNLNSSLSVSKELTPGYRACQKAEVDLCFLVDGSTGMGDVEIKAILEFMKSAMRSLQNSSVNFAAVQFATKAKTEFDFREYQANPDPDPLLENFTQLTGLSFAYKALNHTLNEVFTPRAGSRPNAKKVLLMLTDGEANDYDNSTVIKEIEKRQVTRYIIGIGNNFGTNATRKYLQSLASAPSEEHTRVLQNISQLKDLFAEIERKIVSIEGVSHSSSFPREFSSASLSADLFQGHLLLGDPGIFEWSGGILEIDSTHDTLINMSVAQDRHFGYLGYSVRLMRAPEGLFCLAGAPRYNYRGQVILLQKHSTGWEEINRLHGEQVSSYFGAEIAVSERYTEGLSHLVLISAPHFVEKRWGGRVSVCLFQKGNLSCSAQLRGEPGHPFAQFGAAVSSLSDLDGDGISEVAVGAPYELDGMGALYIFKGDATGVQMAYSQRIFGAPGTRSFGLSVHGVLDMTRDGLTDVLVGSWGKVTLHRSHPLLHLMVNVTFKPQEIPIPTAESSTCESELSAVVCVTSRILTPVYTGELDVLLRYTLTLDPGLPFIRVSLENHKREMNDSFRIRTEGAECHNLSLYLMDCSMEDVSPIQVSLTSRQEVSLWLLSPFSNLNASSQIPFRICENGGICGSDLSLSFRGYVPSDRPVSINLVVREKPPHAVSLELRNMGEVGHQMTLTLSYPEGLSFHKAAIEFLRRVPLSCHQSEPKMTICNMSEPKLRHGKLAVIDVMFHVSPNVSWPETLTIEAKAMSMNETNDTLADNIAKQQFLVLKQINVITKALDKSTKYVNFSDSDQRRVVTHVYQIKNVERGWTPRQLAVSVVTSGADVVVWDIWSVRGEFRCILGNLTETNIHVTGELRPNGSWKVPASISLNSTLTIQYNRSRYHSDSDMFHTAQVITHVELLVLPNHTLYIAAGSVGGIILLIMISVLLYKCGFFTRYKDRMVTEQSAQDPEETVLGNKTEEAELQEPLPSARECRVRPSIYSNTNNTERKYTKGTTRTSYRGNGYLSRWTILCFGTTPSLSNKTMTASYRILSCANIPALVALIRRLDDLRYKPFVTKKVN